MNIALRSEDWQLFLAASTLQRFNVAKSDRQRPADRWDVGIAHVDVYTSRNMPKRINPKQCCARRSESSDEIAIVIMADAFRLAER
jgi:hypothetical protein